MKTSTSLAVLIASLIGAAAAFAGSHYQHHAQQHHRVKHHGATPRLSAAQIKATNPGRELVAALGVFRRGHDVSDDLPLAVAESVARDATQGDLNPALARHVGAAGDVFVIPGTGRSCIVYTFTSGGFGMGCGPDAVAASGAMAGVDLAAPGGSRSVRGVLPDGARNVVVHALSGNIAVAVQANGFSVTAPKDASQLTWTSSDGIDHSQSLRG